MLKKLIKDNKIKFEYYNNKQVPLDLIQICHNQIDDTIELKFRNTMQEYLDEIKQITKKMINKNYNKFHFFSMFYTSF